VDDFGGEIVALNLDSGYYFSLRDLAGAIWRDLVAGHAAEDILSGLHAIDPGLAMKAEHFVAEITTCGLLQPAPDTVPVTTAIESGKLAAAGTVGIVFETYDDMRDLVTTDPIHDVDKEIGWPAREAG
jgi:hypothetical protein